MKKILTSIVDLCSRYKVKRHRLFLGEVGVKRFAKGAQQYLQDIITISMSLNINVCLYAFREAIWNGMNYEFGEHKSSK